MTTSFISAAGKVFKPRNLFRHSLLLRSSIQLQRRECSSDALPDSVFCIAAYPGDGIGVDVTRETFRLLSEVEAVVGGFNLNVDWFPWNSTSYFDEHGVPAPDDLIQILHGYDAIFLGAVGWPDAQEDGITLEPLIRIRQSFDLFACVRPAVTFKGVPHPLSSQEPIDLIVVRENSEGEYVNIGGRFASGTANEIAVQSAVHTRRGVERVLRFGLDLAASPSRRGRLTMVTKSNAQRHGMGFWDDVLVDLVSSGVADGVEVNKMHVDAASMDMVRRPGSFDVIVASNLFGDILTDLSAAVTGSLGLAPSANLDPTRRYPSLFEPVHGSAPDIAGKNVANPFAAFLSAASMLRWLEPNGMPPKAAAIITEAVSSCLAQQESTPDVGGQLSTVEATSAVIKRLHTLQ
mmetsp:Transcript_8800/g.10308  ORF Transcript_8800/g.10308 Transcript_8800/m.10308 type:complete len:405 (+) Transcript_8800:52-1266(+)